MNASNFVVKAAVARPGVGRTDSGTWQCRSCTRERERYMSHHGRQPTPFERVAGMDRGQGANLLHGRH